MSILVVEQRAAFESYIEARLQYSELERDLDGVSTAGSTIAQWDDQPKAAQGMGIRFRGPLVALSGMALVSIISLSFVIIMRKSTAVRDPLPAPLSQSRVDLQSVGGKHDGSGAAPTAMPNTVDPQHSQATRKIVRKEQPSRLRPHTHYEFALTVSRKFKQVGPISISLRGVDSRRQILDLLVKREGSKPAKMRINLNKPIWVKAAAGSRPLELVATQIQGNSVHGF